MLRVLQALDLQLRVRLGIRRHEGRRRDAEHVLRELLLVHQLRAGHAHQLDADAHEADVLDVGRDVGPGPEKRDPGAEGLRLARRCRAADSAGRPSWTMNSPRTMPCVLVFPPRSKPPGFQSRRICCSKLAMIESSHASSSGIGLSSARANPSFGRLHVDQRRRQRRDRIAQHGVEHRAHERIEAPLDVDQPGREIAQHGRGRPSPCWLAAPVGWCSSSTAVDRPSASERLQELDERTLVRVRQRRCRTGARG